MTKRKHTRARPGKQKLRRIIAEHPDRQGAGRHTLLSNAKARKIVEALRRGAHDEIACEYAGVPVRTFYDWVARGEKELDRILSAEQVTAQAVKPLPSEKPFLQFSQSIKLARSGAELSAIKSVERAWRKGDWHAAIAFVERRHRGRWHRMIEADIDLNATTEPAIRITLPYNGRLSDPSLLGNSAHLETEGEMVLRLCEEVQYEQQRQARIEGRDLSDIASREKWFDRLMVGTKAKLDELRAADEAEAEQHGDDH